MGTRGWKTRTEHESDILGQLMAVVQAMIDACELCDERGMADDDSGAVRRCTHGRPTGPALRVVAS